MNPNSKQISEIFGCKTFNDAAMIKYLPQDVYLTLTKTIAEGEPLPKEIAYIVAHGMKEWAMSQGATHFTHWFQPLRGTIAEKHNSFIKVLDMFAVIERFSEDELVQGETDASSFPSGGVRSTFEARGYTAWDPTSPAFIIEDTLCIPSIFLSYSGVALDKKTPLLKANDLLEKEALKILKLLGNTGVKFVRCTIGAEQEYFLTDRKVLENRPDLLFGGRTFLGAASSKGQQMEDHYFGTIREQALNFMRDFEHEMFTLGFPLQTRHNEVAPNQFEFAPIFEQANIACDHNALALEVMNKIAVRHDLAVFFHEKPFNRINGSGKHVNWSMMDSAGHNLLNPGTTENQNIQFLIFLVSVLIGMSRYEKLLKLTILSYSNEFRLGGNEAPPSILSIFIGDYLLKLLETLSATENLTSLPQQFLSTGISKIPKLKLDYTDRNRTSPFAFTGNKFEFRMPGSSSSVAEVVTAMNAIIYHGLKDMAEMIETEHKASGDLSLAVLKAIRQGFLKSRKIIFNGDCYKEEWHKEALNRGLSIANKFFDLHKEIDPAELAACFIDTKVISQSYLDAILEIHKEQYLKSFEIEANVFRDMVKTKIIPACSRQLLNKNQTHDVLAEVLKLSPPRRDQFNQMLIDYADRLYKIQEEIALFDDQLEEFKKSDHWDAKEHLCRELKGKMDQMRERIDSLEKQTEATLWPFLRYDQMLFFL